MVCFQTLELLFTYTHFTVELVFSKTTIHSCGKSVTHGLCDELRRTICNNNGPDSRRGDHLSDYNWSWTFDRDGTRNYHGRWSDHTGVVRSIHHNALLVNMAGRVVKLSV